MTLLDGLVVARSAFESSMNYRSVMVLGSATRLTGDDELDALRTITEHLLPGRWDDCRQPTAKERAATVVLALPLDECSVKIRNGDPEDDPQDVRHPRYAHTWAGVVPIREAFGAPVASKECMASTAVPDYVLAWAR